MSPIRSTVARPSRRFASAPGAAPRPRFRSLRRVAVGGVLGAVAATLLGGALPAGARAAEARLSIELVDGDRRHGWHRPDRHGWRGDGRRHWGRDHWARDRRGHWGSGSYGSWHRVPPRHAPRHGWGWERPGWRSRWDGPRYWDAPHQRSYRSWHRHPHGHWRWRHR